MTACIRSLGKEAKDLVKAIVTKEEEDSLWISYKEKGDGDARQRLIERHAPLVKYLAGRLAIGLPPSVEIDDLVGYGIFGLIDAVDRFDHRRGIKFETYAITRIKGAIWDGLRSMDWVPHSLRQKAKLLEETFYHLEARLGRPATEEEVGETLDMTPEAVRRTLNDLGHAVILSLEEFLVGNSDEGEHMQLKDRIADESVPDPLAMVRWEERRETLGRAIDILPEKEKLVVTLYYYEGLTLKEISEVLQLSPSRISQLHSKAILRMRGKLSRAKEVLLP